jgi:hypothetical protein
MAMRNFCGHFGTFSRFIVLFIYQGKSGNPGFWSDLSNSIARKEWSKRIQVFSLPIWNWRKSDPMTFPLFPSAENPQWVSLSLSLSLSLYLSIYLSYFLSLRRLTRKETENQVQSGFKGAFRFPIDLFMHT